MDATALDRLLTEQCGVVSRRQVLALGGRKCDLDRMVRRRLLVRVHPGVYVNHTGDLTWEQRTWAAVLYAEPAALCLESALPIPRQDGPIHVAIDASRSVRSLPGVRVRRVRGLAGKVRWNLGPPRMRIEHVALDLADQAATELDVVRVLTDVLGSRQTTAKRLREYLARRPRLRRRRLVTGLLDDLESGVCSVLEHCYATRVERAHGLPRPRRQAPRQAPGQAPGRAGAAREYRDVLYEEYGLVVELDGRLHHDGLDQRGRDAERDLADHADGAETVRVRWRQAYGGSCRTAGRIARILQRRGWTGRPTRCGPTCTVEDV